MFADINAPATLANFSERFCGRLKWLILLCLMVGPLVGSQLLGSVGFAAPPLEKLHDQLAALDSVHEKGLTVSAELTSTASTTIFSTLGSRSVAFTCADTRCAIEEVYGRSHYRPPASSDDIPDHPSYADNGNLTVIANKKTRILFDEQKTAKIEDRVESVISPSDALIDSRVVSNRIVFHPNDSIVLEVPKIRLLWTLGRGYARHLKKITKVEGLKDGTLQVVAEGVNGGSAGKWELLIDPSLAYLVRSARFFAPNEKKERLFISNVGLMADADSCYPTNGKYSFDIAGTVVTYELKFNTARLQFDNELMRRISAAFEEPFPPNSDVHDYRTNPGRYQFINRQGEDTSRRQANPTNNIVSASSHGRRRLLLIFNASILGLLAVGLLLRKWRIRARNT